MYVKMDTPKSLSKYHSTLTPIISDPNYLTPIIYIGREEIQKFVVALAVAQSNKGVFITTSSDPPP